MIAMAEVFPMNVLMSEYSQTTLHDHYRLLLGLSAPWEVSQVDLQLRENKVEVRVEWPRGKSPECPECGEAWGVSGFLCKLFSDVNHCLGILSANSMVNRFSACAQF